MPENDPDPARLQRRWLALALFVWAALSLGHGTGLDIVTVMVEWTRQPGSLDAAGGQAGFLVGERILAAFLGLLFFLATALLARRAAEYGALALMSVLPAWILCGGLAWLAWKLIIVYTTELVHFAQYALIGALLSVALGRGRRPQLALVIAFGLGILDEVWQHYGLHVWMLEESTHYLDFSDPFLNGIGAFAGILPAASWLRLREEGESQIHVIYLAAGIAGVVLLPLLWVDPAILSSWFGSYPYYPFWDEHTNLKPVHWVTPLEGIPLMPAFLLLAGSVLDPVRRVPSVAVLAICVLLVGAAIRPLSRAAGTLVHEPVPQARVPSIQEGEITLDGDATEPAWQRAQLLGPFLDNETRAGHAVECEGQPPLPRTQARVLWSSAALYIAFHVTDEDVWARDLPRDHPALLSDEGLRLLIDDGGDEVVFYELGLSPGNRAVDLLQLVPGAPLDFDPWAPTMGWIRFDAPQIEHAVHVAGSLEMVTSATDPVTTAPDTGYVAEIRIPWEIFGTTSSPSSNSVRAALPPRVGQHWRIGLYRLDTPRPTAAVPAHFTPAAAIDWLGLAPAHWPSLMKKRQWSLDASGTLQGYQVWGEYVRRCGRWQAWSPTNMDLRQPGHFGVIEFAAP